MKQVDLSTNQARTWLALACSGCGLIVAMAWLSASLSFSKPARLIPIAGSSLFALASAIVASRGMKPAQMWQVDEAAELACFEAERENALEEIEQEDDMRRYEQRLTIEANAMQRTLPLQMQLQQMKQMLYPVMPVQQIPTMPAPVQGLPQTQGPIDNPAIPQQPLINGIDWFDFNELKDCDMYPVIAVIGGMGAGKSKLLKWLSKHVFLSKDVRACDSFGRKSEWKMATIYPKPENIYQMMEADLEDIEIESDQYRDGKSSFPERLTILEEAPDTLSSLRKYQRSIWRSKPKNEREDVIEDWLLKALTYNRKLRRRSAFVSVSMSATEFIPAEHRNKAVTLFPGTAIDEAMTDIHYYRLGTAQNAKLRDDLRVVLSQVQNPCLIYCKGRWFPAALPALTLEGDPVGQSAPPPQQQQPPTTQQLEDLLGKDFPEGEADR